MALVAILQNNRLKALLFSLVDEWMGVWHFLGPVAIFLPGTVRTSSNLTDQFSFDTWRTLHCHTFYFCHHSFSLKSNRLWLINPATRPALTTKRRFTLNQPSSFLRERTARIRFLVVWRFRTRLKNALVPRKQLRWTTHTSLKNESHGCLVVSWKRQV